jgi:hypothetical protein
MTKDNEHTEENQGAVVPPTIKLPAPKDQFDDLIEDDKLLGIYQDTIDYLKDSSLEIDQVLSQFLDMVMNEGDATSASKEACVSLLKIKSVDIPDKIIKIVDLMTRIKLKERNTMPKYLAQSQNNTYNFGAADKEETTKSILMSEINKASDKKGKK